MGTGEKLTSAFLSAAGRAAAAAMVVGGIVLTSTPASAQQPAPSNSDDPGFFTSIGRWFERQGNNIGSVFKDTGQKIENFGHEAGVAARTTAEGARGAADTVARIPNVRVVTGHEKCRIAANGAPDCLTAAMTICKSKGFEGGKSLDMTTAQVCPTKALLSGRIEPGECHDETFVSRALCQ